MKPESGATLSDNHDTRQAEWAILGREALDAIAPLFRPGCRFHSSIPLGASMIAAGIPALVAMVDEARKERERLAAENLHLKSLLASAGARADEAQRQLIIAARERTLITDQMIVKTNHLRFVGGGKMPRDAGTSYAVHLPDCDPIPCQTYEEAVEVVRSAALLGPLTPPTPTEAPHDA